VVALKAWAGHGGRQAGACNGGLRRGAALHQAGRGVRILQREAPCGAPPLRANAECAPPGERYEGNTISAFCALPQARTGSALSIPIAMRREFIAHARRGCLLP
jgi:hypothetical protein